MKKVEINVFKQIIKLITLVMNEKLKYTRIKKKKGNLMTSAINSSFFTQSTLNRFP